MSEYIDLVVCKHYGNDTPFLFQAPAWSHLKEGDRVVVDTRKGEHEATVVFSDCVDVESDEMNLAICASNATLPLRKVLKKVVYREFEYKEDEDEQSN